MLSKKQRRLLPLVLLFCGLFWIDAVRAQGEVSFQPRRDFALAGLGTPRSILVGDFNNDQINDLAILAGGTGAAGIHIRLGNGDGTFRSVGPALPTPAAAVIGDFNGDGVQDLAGIYGTGISIMFGQGDGRFGPPQSINVFIQQMNALAVGDFNGDGIPDLAVTDADIFVPLVHVLLGNGDGTFQPPRTFRHGSAYALSVTVSDFNGDGIQDLAVLIPNGISILLGNGDGTFQSPQMVFIGASPISVAPGDFNGDEITDLAVAQYNPAGGVSGVSILLGNGDGTFQPPQFYAGGSGGAAVAVADFNGDGRLDMAMTSSGAIDDLGTTVSIWLGNGDGTFRRAQNFPVGSAPGFVLATDFNGDNRPDLAIGSSIGSSVSILLNNSAKPERSNSPSRTKAEQRTPVNY